jgi:DKNYY family
MQTIFFIIGLPLVILLILMASIGSVFSPKFHGAKAIDNKLSDQYYFKKEKVVYVPFGNFFELGDREVDGSDKDSFTVLSYNIAKDNNHIYYNGELVPSADVSSFELLEPAYTDSKNYKFYTFAKDKDRVFYYFEPIASAQPESFERLWGAYSKDKDKLFYENKELFNLSEQVERITNDKNNNYISVDGRIYFEGRSLTNIDFATFKALEHNFAVDKKHVYYENNISTEMSPKGFEVIDAYYQKDEKYLYRNLKALKFVDLDTYKSITELYSKDKNHVYYIGAILQDAKPEYFSKKDILKIEKDYESIFIYQDDDHVTRIKRDELIEITSRHSHYKQDIYVGNIKLEGADLKSFAVIADTDDLYAYDKNYVYYFLTIIRNVDISSFGHIADNFSKDKKYLYYMQNIVADQDPKTFIYQEGMYANEMEDGRYKLIYPNMSVE